MRFWDQCPELPIVIRDLPDHGYLPIDEDDEESGAHALYIDMNQQQLDANRDYTLSQHQTLGKKAEAIRELMKYRQVMGIPEEMTIRQWIENGRPRL
jgi:hypothetical protein